MANGQEGVEDSGCYVQMGLEEEEEGSEEEVKVEDSEKEADGSQGTRTECASAAVQIVRCRLRGEEVMVARLPPSRFQGPRTQGVIRLSAAAIEAQRSRPPVTHPSTPPPPHILKYWKEKEKEKEKAANMKIVKRARKITALRFYCKYQGFGPILWTNLSKGHKHFVLVGF